MPTLLAPRYLGAHLLMVLAVVIATGLGIWQLDAWQSRRADAQRDLTTAQPRPLSSVMGPDEPFPGQSLGRPVALSGEWLTRSTMYVSDRREGDRYGYWVVTPVQVSGTSSAMPVVRGWSPRPSGPAVSGSVRLTGWLQPGEGSNLLDEDPDDDVIPEMRIASMVQHVPTDLYGGFVIDQSAGPGLSQVSPTDAPPVGSTTALRNLLYAIEWWVFALFAFVVWVRWCRDTLDPERRSDEADEPVTSTEDPVAH
ncbi:SURF1-like protein [Marmoricola endophyticus]|uniref:SURF1-like protein n=1 Tax=Marmoricola endophyticus TaxID=2040280 RepID=A0A917BKZ3_9ACTN|nr:SURF1 family protein [Marmoricola endophyticus]GGF47362.1 SURF1-like protein [Marmoricola endophyticus]